MLTPPENDLRDASVLIGLLAVLLFASPLMSWWIRGDGPWYLLYLLWLIVIGLGALIHSRSSGHGHD
jgi:hypothetical protein